jgi:glutamate--cysteine ligase
VRAFWVGLLYDDSALEAAWSLVKDWTAEERQALRDGVPRLALKTPFRNGKVLEVAREAMAISRSGLAARSRKNSAGEDEREYLAPVEEIVASGRTIAEQLLEAYHGPWKGDVRRVFAEYAF